MNDGAMNSFHSEQVRTAFMELAYDLGRPSRTMKPRVYVAAHGGWCAVYGDDVQSGVVGYGDTPEAACQAFDKEWVSK